MTQAWAAASRLSEAVSARALDGDDQRQSKQDDRHSQALDLAVAHVHHRQRRLDERSSHVLRDPRGWRSNRSAASRGVDSEPGSS
jgi:hypothetical protein